MNAFAMQWLRNGADVESYADAAMSQGGAQGVDEDRERCVEQGKRLLVDASRELAGGDRVEVILHGSQVCQFEVGSDEWDRSEADEWGSFFDDGGHAEIWIGGIRPLDEVATSPDELRRLLARSLLATR